MLGVHVRPDGKPHQEGEAIPPNSDCIRVMRNLNFANAQTKKCVVDAVSNELFARTPVLLTVVGTADVDSPILEANSAGRELGNFFVV